MTPHPQAELLRAIADGLLLERDTAFGNLEWKACLPDIALSLIAQGRDGELRIKPKTILIGGIENRVADMLEADAVLAVSKRDYSTQQMRDYFAAKAMQSLVINCAKSGLERGLAESCITNGVCSGRRNAGGSQMSPALVVMADSFEEPRKQNETS